jgi:hypothetical protein
MSALVAFLSVPDDATLPLLQQSVLTAEPPTHETGPDGHRDARGTA